MVRCVSGLPTPPGKNHTPNHTCQELEEFSESTTTFVETLATTSTVTVEDTEKNQGTGVGLLDIPSISGREMEQPIGYLLGICPARRTRSTFP